MSNIEYPANFTLPNQDISIGFENYNVQVAAPSFRGQCVNNKVSSCCQDKIMYTGTKYVVPVFDLIDISNENVE